MGVLTELCLHCISLTLSLPLCLSPSLPSFLAFLCLSQILVPLFYCLFSFPAFCLCLCLHLCASVSLCLCVCLSVSLLSHFLCLTL